MIVKITKYTPEDYTLWNQFVATSKNATFLFHRDFMEYHRDRFEDYSLLFFNENHQLIAVLPANRVGTEVFSHQGLTYGGLIFEKSMKLEKALLLFEKLLAFLDSNGFEKLILKSIPSIYCDCFSNEIDYALFLTRAKLIRRDTLAVIDLTKEFNLSYDRKKNVKKGLTNQLVVKEEEDFSQFWNDILIPNLWHKHQAKPVHTLAEIVALKKLFPENIRQFNVYKGTELIGGTTIFESKHVAHVQYISIKALSKERGALDVLFYELITKVFKHKIYFDFGISNEDQGKKLNAGLSYWKESFGANILTQDFYKVKTKNYVKLNQVIL